MPLLIITGLPASGKSTLAEKIAQFLRKNRNKIVEIVSDETNDQFSLTIFSDSHKEREHRNFLRSEVQKRLTKNNVVICDSLNYIKGYRYELFCIAKLVKTTYCVLFCHTDEETCKFLNSGNYSEKLINELIMRFECPEGKNRWDSPLFTILINRQNTPENVDLPLIEISNCLLQAHGLSPNMSTKTTPLAQTNLLYEIDKTTQNVVQCIIGWQKTAIPGDSLTLSECGEKFYLRKPQTLAEMARVRRQFITYTKSHPIEDGGKIASLFVTFLNANQ